MQSHPTAAPPRLASSRWALVGGAVVLFAAVAFGAWMRVHAALHDPWFDATQAEGMLKSDPALLYYFVERILESGGWLPADVHADPRILHPTPVDVTALFPLGMEFVVAWWRMLSGSGEPLHMTCLRVTSVLASCAAIGVYGLALELTRRVGWALAALGVFTFTWANYRTVGFLLVGEDFSVPWFALHLYLLARAARLRTPASIVLAALTWIAALATWHATSFFASIEAVLVWAWFARSGANPLAAPKAWLFPVVAFALSLLVPILWGTRFYGALPVQILFGLAAAAWLAHRGTRSHGVLVAASIAAAAAWFGIAWLVARALGGELSEYGPVWGLLAAKLRYLGELPTDPLALPAEVRLMWQGPFATAQPGDLASQLGFGLLVLPLLVLGAGRAWMRRGGGASTALLGAALIVGLVLAWLISRTVILPGLLLPVAVAGCCSEWSARWASQRARTGIAAALVGLVFVQAADCADRVRGFESSWYRPPQRQQELRALVRALPSLVPDGEAIASDFMNSTAILAHTRHPILLQPKYEDRESRRRAVQFFDAIYHRTPDEVRRMLLDEYQCRYLVLDRFTLTRLGASLYLGGVRSDARPTPGTWWELLAREAGPTLPEVRGYRLLYRSPTTIRDDDGRATDFYRVYEVVP
ncbi:MAG: hypothetical protein HZA53_02845 [Planctomycetes bacterium]|nr:hypothetical protein [Planctomycetota bacterium]